MTTPADRRPPPPFSTRIIVSTDDLALLANTLGPYHPFTARVRGILQEQADPALAKYRAAAARTCRSHDNLFDLDDDAIVAENQDGAYVMTWLWIPDDELR